MKSRPRLLITTFVGLLIVAAVISHRMTPQVHFPPNLAVAATPTQGQPLAQYPGVYAFRQITSMCSTAGTADSTCAEPTVTLPTAFTLAGTYVISCTCVGAVTGSPGVVGVTEAAASPKVQVVIASFVATTGSCTEVDCMATTPTVANQ